MSQDFQAAGQQQRNNNSGEETNFQQSNGGADTQHQQTDDNPVVLEYGGRQFTKDDIVKKFEHGDSHISNLTGKLDDQAELLAKVNETLQKQVNAAEVLQGVQQQNQQTEGAASQNQQTNQETSQKTAVEVDPNEIAQQVRSQLAQENQEATLEKNWETVTTKLTEAYGDNTNSKVKEVAGSFGMSMEQAQKMARETPKAFLQLFPEASAPKKEQSSFQQSGQVNSQALSAQASQNQETPASKWFQSKTTRDRTQMYLSRLKELGF